MILSLHKNATNNPAIRAKIAAGGEPAAVLSGRNRVSLDTVYVNGRVKVSQWAAQNVATLG
jgi:hypothetical protein